MHTERTGIHESGKLKQARRNAVLLTCCTAEAVLATPSYVHYTFQIYYIFSLKSRLSKDFLKADKIWQRKFAADLQDRKAAGIIFRLLSIEERGTSIDTCNRPVRADLCADADAQQVPSIHCPGFRPDLYRIRHAAAE